MLPCSQDTQLVQGAQKLCTSFSVHENYVVRNLHNLKEIQKTVIFLYARFAVSVILLCENKHGEFSLLHTYHIERINTQRYIMLNIIQIK